ncbi:MAG: hypothetical protein KF906_05055 [Actinobacteria bacterium]|nr:hypothetical protein [Actinomycetota bacterium]
MCSVIGLASSPTLARGPREPDDTTTTTVDPGDPFIDPVTCSYVPTPTPIPVVVLQDGPAPTATPIEDGSLFERVDVDVTDIDVSPDLEASIRRELVERDIASGSPYVVLYPASSDLLTGLANGLPGANADILILVRSSDITSVQLVQEWKNLIATRAPTSADADATVGVIPSDTTDEQVTGTTSTSTVPSTSEVATTEQATSWTLTVEPAPASGTTWPSPDSTVEVDLLDADGRLQASCELRPDPDGSTSGFPATLTVDGAPEGARVQITRDGSSVAVVDLVASTDCEGDPFSCAADADVTVPTVQAADDTSSGSSPFMLLLVGLGGVALGAGALTLARRFDDGPDGPVPAFAGGPPPNFGGPYGQPLPPAIPPPAPPPAGPTAFPVVSAPGTAPVPPRPAPPGWTGAVPLDRSIRLGELGLNRLLPIDLPAGRAWAYEAAGVLAAAGWLEKKEGRGEDAEPTLLVHEDGRAILGAFDGTGGAGAAVARRLRDGTELTGAYVGARIVRDLTETWGLRRLENGPVGDPNDLTQLLAQALRDEATSLPPSGGVRGSLSRVLPTTAAVIAITPRPDRATWAEAIWAGDSRAFALTPNHGLQALTVDDTRETDALALIRNDQPMTNLISADRRFHLNHRAIERTGPAVFMVATDGCFGYVPTPAHFEHLVLGALMDADHVARWPELILGRLAEVAADDVSFALVTTGFDGFAALREAFEARYEYLDREHWRLFADASDPGDRERLREASWAVYRERYEALMDRPDAADGSPGAGR